MFVYSHYIYFIHFVVAIKLSIPNKLLVIIFTRTLDSMHDKHSIFLHFDRVK